MKWASSALAFAILSLPAAAAETDGAAEPVVVTATRTPQTAATTIRPVDIVTGEDIQASAQQTLGELLQTRTNVEIASTGGFGQPASLFIRGANANHTLVLLDGMRLNNPLSSLTSFENLRGNQFSRIELVPGPLSSLYGPEAVGGVVQLFGHRWPDAPRAYASVGIGGYDTTNFYGGVSGGTQSTGVSVNAGYLDSGGFSAAAPSEPFGSFNPDRDKHRNRNTSASLVHRFAPDQEAGINAFYTDGFTRFDASPASDDVNRQRIGVYSGYSRNRISDSWTSLIRLGTMQDQISTQGFYPGNLASSQTQFTWQNDFRTAIGTAIGGVEYLNQRARGTNDFLVSRRDIYSGFLGYTGEFAAHIVHASVRHDDNSQFGGETTGAVGYAYRVTESLRVRASAGSAFHAPTFYDLYFPYIGNPDLKPERSRSWEIGADLIAPAQHLGLTFFQNHIRDLIVLRPPTFTAVNIDEARIQGVELSYRAEMNGFELLANLTVQNPHNAETDKQLQRRARVFGNLSVGRTIGAVRAGAELVGAGKRYDSSDESPSTKLDRYVTLNLFGSYAVTRDLTLELRWDNVADAHYELAQGYNTPGSNVFVSLRYWMAR